MARPLSPKLVFARNLMLLAVVAAAVPSVAKYLRDFERDDPIGALAIRDTAPSDVLMRMEGVRMKHYDKTGLVTYAKANEIDLHSDRNTYELIGVRDALYRGPEGTFRYAASHARFNEGVRRLKADGEVHIQNKDLDLKSKTFEYNGLLGNLLVHGSVTGKLKGGQIEATNVAYNLSSEAFHAGPVYWKGMLALDLQGKEEDRPRTWDIRGDKIEYSGKGQQIATYTNAIASDDEVILIAPKVVHDRKTDVLTATGRVQYFSAKADLVADQCVIYRKEKRAELVGGVLMYVKPKKDQDGKPKVEPLPNFQPLNPDDVKPAPPGTKLSDEEKKKADEVRDSKSIRDFPMVMVSSKIDYWYAKGSRRAVITGAPQGRQELPESRWRHVWTNVAYYDGEKETLKLVSTKNLKDTHMKDSIGDDLVADWMEVSTKEDEDQMSGFGFQGKVVSLEDETGGNGAPGSTPPQTPPVKGEPPKTGTGSGTGKGGGDPKKTGGG